ncbi:microtubule-associated protein 2-like isoform X2 [Limulus polyphemus]|uniref:Microtubule-associated protein n=1 Tax=Limulus polyphemus TaxID=6850 RepID=A0ABM1S8E9_LIMPO|nr:microtubule-associated protein 2-like isoform X2 [Limulus polyphemus]
MDQKVSSSDTKQTEESTIEKGIKDSTIPETCDTKNLNGKFKPKSAVSEKDANLQQKAIDDYTHAQEKKTLSTSDKKEDFFQLQTNSTQQKSDSTLKNNSETEISKSDDKQPRSTSSTEELGNKTSHIQKDTSFIVNPTQEDNRSESMDDSQNVKNDSTIKEKDAYLSEKFLDKTVAKDGVLADSAQLNGKVPCEDTLRKTDNSSLLSEAAKKGETNKKPYETKLPEKAKLAQDSERHEIDHGVSNNEVISKNGVEIKQVIEKQDSDYNYIEAKVKLDYMTTERSEKEPEVSKLISDQNRKGDDHDLSTQQLASEITSSIVSQAKLTVSESGSIVNDKIRQESEDMSMDLKEKPDLKDSQMHTELSSHQIKCEKTQENNISKENREEESNVLFERKKDIVQVEKDTNINFTDPKEIKLEEKRDTKKDEDTSFSVDSNMEDPYSVSEQMTEDTFKNQHQKDKDIAEQVIPTKKNTKEEEPLKLEPEKSKLGESGHFTSQQKEPLKELNSELCERQPSKQKVISEDVTDKKNVTVATAEGKLGKDELSASEEEVTQEKTESQTHDLLSKEVISVKIKNYDLSAEEKEVSFMEMKSEREEQIDKKVDLLETKVGKEKSLLTEKLVSVMEANPKEDEQPKAKKDFEETEKEQSIPAEKDILEGESAGKAEQPRIEEKIISNGTKFEKEKQSVETKQEEVKQNLEIKHILEEIKPEKEELQTTGIEVILPEIKPEKDKLPSVDIKVTPPKTRSENEKQPTTYMKDTPTETQLKKEKQPVADMKATPPETKSEKENQSTTDMKVTPSETQLEKEKQSTIDMKVTPSETKPEKEKQPITDMKVTPSETKPEKEKQPITDMKVTPSETQLEKEKQSTIDMKVTPSETKPEKEKQPITDMKATPGEMKTEKEMSITEMSISPEKTKPVKEDELTIDMKVIPEKTKPESDEALKTDITLETQPGQYKLQVMEKRINSVETKPLKEELITTETEIIIQETKPEKDKTPVAETKSEPIELSRIDEKAFLEKAMSDKNELQSPDKETVSKQLPTEARTEILVEPKQEMDKLTALENQFIPAETKAEKAKQSPQEQDNYSIETKAASNDLPVIEKEASLSEPKLEKSKVSETETKSTLVETKQKDEVPQKGEEFSLVETKQEKYDVLQQEKELSLVRTKQEKGIPPSTEYQGISTDSTSEKEHKDSEVETKPVTDQLLTGEANIILLEKKLESDEVISEKKIDPVDILKEKDKLNQTEDELTVVETIEQKGELQTTTEKKTILVNPKSETDGMKMIEKTDLPMVEKKIDLSEVTLKKEELMKPEEKIACDKILLDKDELLQTENKLKPLEPKEEINKLLTIEEKTALVETEEVQDKLSLTVVNGEPPKQDESLTTEEKFVLVDSKIEKEELKTVEMKVTSGETQAKIDDIAKETTKPTSTKEKPEKEIPQHKAIPVETKLGKDKENVITEKKHVLVESMPEKTQLPVRKDEIVFEENISGEGKLIATKKASEKSDLKSPETKAPEEETISKKADTSTEEEKISSTETKTDISIEPTDEKGAKIVSELIKNSKTEFRHIAVGIEPRFIRIASSCGEETEIEETNETREIEISDDMVESDEQAATAGASGTGEVEQPQMQITEYQYTSPETTRTTDKEEEDSKLNIDDKEKISLTKKEPEKSKEVPEAHYKDKIVENYKETPLTHSDDKVKEHGEEMSQTIVTKSTQPFVSDAQVPVIGDLSVTATSAPKQTHLISESTIQNDISLDISMKDKSSVKTEGQLETTSNKEEPTKGISGESFISDDKSADEGIDTRIPISPTKEDESENNVKDKPIVGLDEKKVESIQEKAETAVLDDVKLNEVEGIKPVAQFLTKEAVKEKENLSQAKEDVQTVTKSIEKVTEEEGIALTEDKKDKVPKVSYIEEGEKIQSPKPDEIKEVADSDTAKPKVDIPKEKPEDKTPEGATDTSKPLEQKKESISFKDQQENKSIKDHSELEKTKTDEDIKVVEDKTNLHDVLPCDSTVIPEKQDNQQQKAIVKEEKEAKGREYEEIQLVKEDVDNKDKTAADELEDKYVLRMPVDSPKREILKEETQVTATLDDKEVIGKTTAKDETGKTVEPKHDENKINVDKGTEKREDKESKLQEKHILQHDISPDISDAKEVKLQDKPLPEETSIEDTEKLKEIIRTDEHKEDKLIILHEKEQIKTDDNKVQIVQPINEKSTVTSYKTEDQKDTVNKEQLTTLMDKDLVKEPKEEEKQTQLEAEYPLFEKTDKKERSIDTDIDYTTTTEKIIPVEDDKALQKKLIGKGKLDSTPSSVPLQLAKDKVVTEEVMENNLKEKPSLLSEDAYVSIKKPETEVLLLDNDAAKEPTKQPLEDSDSRIDLKQKVDEKHFEEIEEKQGDIPIQETEIKLLKSEEDDLISRETSPKAPSTSTEPSNDKSLPTSPTKEAKVKEQPKQFVKSPTKLRPSRTPPKTLSRKEVAGSPEIPKTKTPTSPIKRLSHSPKKAPLRNGIPSPTKFPQRLPPIKAPVGQAPMPNLRNVKSKIGSLDNIKYKPSGGEKKQLLTKKLEWVAAPRVGSLENTTYKPGGGVKKITTQKLEWKVEPKVGDKNIGYTPGGGQVKIESRKLEWKQKASSKVGSMDNVKHKPGGGQTKVKSEKMILKDKVSSKVGSLPASEKASSQGSETKSPIHPSSPQFDEQSQLPPVDEPYDEEPTETNEQEDEATSQKPETAEEALGLQDDESKPEVVETATEPEATKEYKDEDAATEDKPETTVSAEPKTAGGVTPESTGIGVDHEKSETKDAKDGDVAEKPPVEC